MKEPVKEGVKRKISFNAGGAGGVSAKVSLPIAMLRDLKIDKESPNVKITQAEDEIIIKKLKTDN